MKLFSFLGYIQGPENVYIRFKNEKISVTLVKFMCENADWALYRVCHIKPDCDDLIIEIEKYH